MSDKKETPEEEKQKTVNVEETTTEDLPTPKDKPVTVTPPEFLGFEECDLEIDPSRPIVTVSKDVPVSPLNTLVLSSSLYDESYIDKLHPDGIVETDAATSVMISDYVVDTNEALYSTHKGKVSNIISGTNKDGEVRKSAISKSKPKLNGSTLVGEAAVLAITTNMGMSGQIEVPLVNSGFRLRINRLSGDDLAILDEQLLVNKGEFGRMTIGTSMGFNSSYLRRDIINAILRAVVSHNIDGVRDTDIDAIRKRIKSRDYKSLLTAVMVGSFPDGFSANIPCTNTKTKCRHVTTGYVNAARCFHVDHGLLTDKQLEIITRPISEKVTDVELEEYQADFNTEKDFFEFSKNGSVYRFDFQNCNLENNIRSGITWAANINKAINRFIANKDDPEVRKRVVNNTLNTNVLAQFGGWFKSITILDEETREVQLTVIDQDTIIKVLKEIYSDEKVNDVFEAINKYIYSGNPVTIGVPEYPCPVCGEDEVKSILVPLDIESLFFIHQIDQGMLSMHFELTDLTT
ncbi:hypothetical protein TSMG0034 [Halocynthia phage JM-2012]|uniref:hypothetical protein n=1 Tax=Halocynthia phage JM-2012 TaxID=1173297 RepID=UPI00025C68F1|nr:hypothetical protein TSMG0034 [Halocynthia phage JM-2012]AFI55317.1 hypothetical protein TSMG0034 [Halocynthia phage JM-2012]